MRVTIWVEDNHMNLANENFATLWRALGLECDWVGHLSPDVILKAIEGFDSELIVKPTEWDGNVCHCGITKEQAANYSSRLAEICRLAQRNGKMVSWG